MTRINNDKGVVILGTILVAIILFGLGGAFALRAINEANFSRIENSETVSFYAAHGGAQEGLRQLDILINTYLQSTIASSNPSGVISYTTSQVNNADGISWLVYSTRNNNVAVLTQNGEQAEYAQSGNLGSGSYSYKIIMTEKSDPVTVDVNTWDFPYSFRIESRGAHQ